MLQRQLPGSEFQVHIGATLMLQALHVDVAGGGRGRPMAGAWIGRPGASGPVNFLITSTYIR